MLPSWKDLKRCLMGFGGDCNDVLLVELGHLCIRVVVCVQLLGKHCKRPGTAALMIDRLTHHRLCIGDFPSVLFAIWPGEDAIACYTFNTCIDILLD